MYSRILVPLDGSNEAEQVLPYVRALGKSFKPRIDLITTYQPMAEELADPAHHHYSHQIDDNRRADSLDYLHRVKSGQLDDLGVAVTYTVEDGHPADWIITEAAKQPNTLIAMSTHGRSGIARWVLGSTTDKVLHGASTPILIIRSQNEDNIPRDPQLKSIIVPLDGSLLAEKILPHVTELARAMGLRVILVRVTPHFEEAALEYLRGVASITRGRGVAAVEERLLHGHPAAAIVDYAMEIDHNLVAMTTHGRSGVGRWMLGSVTDRVVQHSGDPVLVVRAHD
jgi:nucleotide-binding universal stress UspA family protein